MEFPDTPQLSLCKQRLFGLIRDPVLCIGIVGIQMALTTRAADGPIEFSAEVIFATNSLQIATGRPIPCRLVFQNTSAERVEIDSVRYPGKEAISLFKKVSDRFGTNATLAYWDQIRVRFSSTNKVYETSIPFPYHGEIFPRQVIGIVATLQAPPEAGLYTLELRPESSTAEVQDNFISLEPTKVVSSDSIRPVILKQLLVSE